MEAVNVITLIVSGLTLLVTSLTAVLTYRLEKQKKKIDRLEKSLTISLENLQACYEVEEFYAQKLNISKKKIQYEINEWLKDRNVELTRKYFRPSYFKDQLLILRK